MDNYFEMPDVLIDYLKAKGEITDFEDGTDFEDERRRPARTIPAKIDWSLHFDRMKEILDGYIGPAYFPVPENDIWGLLLEKLEELLEQERVDGP